MIESAGSRNGSLEVVQGIKRPDGKNPPEELRELKGQVYHATNDTTYDGLLRVELTGGGDGSGTVEADIIASKAGPQTYKDKDGNDVVEERVHAGDDETPYSVYLQTDRNHRRWCAGIHRGYRVGAHRKSIP